MSYLDLLNESERNNLGVINNINEYCLTQSQALKDAPIPFDKARITIRDKIILISNFKGDFYYGIEFKDCYFKTKVSFQKATFNKPIIFNNCFFDNGINFSSEVIFGDTFDLIGISVQGGILVNGGEYGKCRWSTRECDDLKVNGGIFSKLKLGYWSNTFLKTVNFDFKKISGVISIGGFNAKIEKLSLNYYSSDIKITIEDLKTNCITLHRFRNDNLLRFSNILFYEVENKSTEFSAFESYFGGAEFFSIDFTQVENLYFRDVHLADCSFISIIWKYQIDSFIGCGTYRNAEEVELNTKIKKIRNEFFESVEEIDAIKKDPKVIEFYNRNRDIYRQLKYALSKQGDIVNEQKFHSLEMINYNRSLLFEKDIWTKLIIKMSYWFSDFGQSFIKPLVWLLVGNFILFNILVLRGQFMDLNFDFQKASWCGFEKGFEYYLQMMNPLRKNEFMIKGYNLLLDYAMRIWSSYMIYNIVRATRRFIK